MKKWLIKSAQIKFWMNFLKIQDLIAHSCLSFLSCFLKVTFIFLWFFSNLLLLFAFLCLKQLGVVWQCFLNQIYFNYFFFFLKFIYFKKRKRKEKVVFFFFFLDPWRKGNNTKESSIFSFNQITKKHYFSSIYINFFFS